MKKSKALKKKISTSDSLLKKYAKVQIMNFIIFIAVFFISALISLLVGIKSSSIFLVSIITFSLSSLICAYISAFRNRKNGICTGILSIALQIVVFELISVIINGFSIDYNILITSAFMILAAVIGGIAGVNTRLKPKIKRGK